MSPRNIFMLNFIVPLSIFILFLATSNAQSTLKSELSSNSNSNPNVTSPPSSKPSPNPNPNPNPIPNPNPTVLPHSSKPSPNPHSNPNSNPTPNPTILPHSSKPSSNPHSNPNSNSTPNPTILPHSSKSSPNPNPNTSSNQTTSLHDKKPTPSSNSNLTSPHSLKPSPNSNPNPTTSPHDKRPTTNPNPNSKPTPKPKSKPAPKPNKPNSKPITTSRYQLVNHFCLSRRLDVEKTFCLQVLRSSPASTKAKDNQALLGIVADAAIQFSNKNIASMKKTSKDKKTKPDLKATIEECVSAYEGYLEQFKTLIEEATIEAQLAGYDSELAKLQINRCVKALSKDKNAEIETGNKIALDYARLSQNIADSI